MNYQKTPCAHRDCETLVRRRAPSGLCITHFKAATRSTKRCRNCDARTDSKMGLCASCRAIAQAKTCIECGKPYSGRARKSGKCAPCYWKESQWSRSVPADRVSDLYTLRRRGHSRESAVEIVLSGVPVIRRQVQQHPNIKIPAMTVLRMVADALLISESEILSPSRFRETVEARSVVVEVMRRQGMSYPRIGARLNRDHSSVLTLCRSFPRRAAHRPVLGRLADTIMEQAA